MSKEVKISFKHLTIEQSTCLEQSEEILLGVHIQVYKQAEYLKKDIAQKLGVNPCIIV
jgi:hypothetical protein